MPKCRTPKPELRIVMRKRLIFTYALSSNFLQEIGRLSNGQMYDVRVRVDCGGKIRILGGDVSNRSGAAVVAATSLS